MPTQALRYLVKQTLDSLPWQRKLQPTLPAEQVPFVLHEPAIMAGYRVPYKPWTYYGLSLFQLHNETVNVWTHLIGCCIIINRLYGYFHEFDLNKDAVLGTLLIFGITCIIGLLTSALVHLLHGKSPYIHIVAFMIDYIGATFCSFGSGIMAIYALCDKGAYDSMEPYYVPLLTLSSYLNFINLCVAKLWYGHDPYNLNRKYMFLVGMSIQAFINMAPFAPRYVTCYYDDTCSMMSLNHLTVMQIVFVLEAITFAAHQPEKTWPGKFDIVGHGHQIFHVLIVINHVIQLDAIYSEHQIGFSSHSQPDVVGIFVVMAVMYIADALTLMILTKYVPASLERVERTALAQKKMT